MTSEENQVFATTLPSKPVMDIANPFWRLTNQPRGTVIGHDFGVLCRDRAEYRQWYPLSEIESAEEFKSRFVIALGSNHALFFPETSVPFISRRKGITEIRFILCVRIKHGKLTAHDKSLLLEAGAAAGFDCMQEEGMSASVVITRPSSLCPAPDEDGDVSTWVTSESRRKEVTEALY